MKRLIFSAFLCVWFVGCGDDSTPDKGANNAVCTSNTQCATGYCDLSTGACTQAPGNNSTNNTNNVAPVCGNGRVEAGETCDGNCPTSCAAADACSTVALVGSAASCDAACEITDVVDCVDADGCCPAACSSDSDSDCPVLCGNLTVDEGETCDSAFADGIEGACPRPQDCQPTACMTATYSGTATQCNAVCQTTEIVACVDNDGCCPAGCDLDNDTDCLRAVGERCTADEDCAGAFCIQANGWTDGYCTAACATDADCGADAYCNGRACMATCASDNECRAGYSCYDYFGDGRSMCAPPATLTVAGTTCTTADTCATSYFGAVCLPAESGFEDGYCTSGCEVDADCPGDAYCSQTETGGLCTPTCSSNADCRSGYSCRLYFDAFARTCAPSATGSGLVGDTCDVLQDCAGGDEGACIRATDWQAGYCTLAPCATNNDCSAGSHCAYDADGSGICLKDCATAMDCRPGYGCLDGDDDLLLECIPGGVGSGIPGDACATVADCAGGVDGVCIKEEQGWRGGYCSLGDCTADADCGDVNTYHCAFDANGPGLCVKTCATAADCRADGYGCRDYDNDSVTECAPAGTGTKLPGDSCDGVWECAGGSRAFCVAAWPQGYCALDDCISDGECGTGGHCGFVSATTGSGICISSCNSDADCRDGYACFDIDGDLADECMPVGDRRVGAACDSFADCAGGADAVCAPDPDFTNGYCSVDCTASGVCPGDNICVAFTSASYCFDACSSSAQCRDDYYCGRPTGAAASVCLPL